MRKSLPYLVLVGVLLARAEGVMAQAPAGPITVQPGVTPQKAPVPVFRLRSILVNTPVTVRDSSGEMVHDLESTDFRVLDNGEEQKITHFDLGGDPISLAVVVETSSRIGPLLPQIRRTGILISETVMGPTGEAAVIGYDDQVKILTNFTSSTDQIEHTLAKLEEGDSGTRLFDAMSKAVELLGGRPEVSVTDLGKRRVMLVIGEAHDAGSEEKLGEVLRRAQLENITIYAVGISGVKADLKRKNDPDSKGPTPLTPEGTVGPPPPPGTVDTPTTEMQQAEAGMPLAAVLDLAIWAVKHAKDQVTARQLEIAAAATGGEHVSVWRDRSIEKVIDEIGGELHAQYTLSYTPKETTDGYHEISVLVDRKGLSVRARPGYYLEGPGG